MAGMTEIESASSDLTDRSISPYLCYIPINGTADRIRTRYLKIENLVTLPLRPRLQLKRPNSTASIQFFIIAVSGLGPQLFPGLEDSTAVISQRNAGLDVSMSTTLGDPRSLSDYSDSFGCQFNVDWQHAY